MRKTLLLAASTAALTLAACNSEPETITVNQYDAQAKALENAAPVQLPPAIMASRTYRCSDNSLVYIDFYTNNTAAVRTARGTPPGPALAAGGGNPPYTGSG